MQLHEKYPKIFEKLEDKELELRHLLNVDENYEDYDSEEFEFDFEEYNYVLYIAEPLQKTLGEEKLAALAKALETHEAFENFWLSEEDLYGVKSELSESAIVEVVLDQVEALL